MVTANTYTSPFTYTYKITSLKVKDEVVGNTTNHSSVVQTYWQLTGTDANNHVGTFSGATPFTSTIMPAGDTFIPFASLTEANVIKWVSDVVTGNPSYQQHIDEQIQKQIDQIITPVTEAAMPWAPAANTANTAANTANTAA
jgi:hypothetical protein